MKKEIQIAIIPFGETILENNLVYDETNKEYGIANQNIIDVSLRSKQLLILSDETLNLNDFCVTKNLKHLYHINNVDVLLEDAQNYAEHLGLLKVIASYPNLEGTLTISKETILEWIDKGSPDKALALKINYKNGLEYAKNGQKNIILAFDYENEVSYYPDGYKITNEEAKEWVQSVKPNYKTFSEEDLKNAFLAGYEAEHTKKETWFHMWLKEYLNNKK